MIRIRHSTQAGLEVTEHPIPGSWIEVVNPTPDEVKRLIQELEIPQEFINFSLDSDEIPLVEKDGNTLLIVVRIPHFQGQTAKAPYVTVPMGLIMIDDRLFTICRFECDLLQHLPREQQVDLTTSKTSRFVLHLLWSIANSYLRHLNDVNRAVERLEERVVHALQNREVLELLRYQKSLLHFATSLRANETMMERLQRGKFLHMNKSDEDLLDDVFTETRQAIGMSAISSDILAQMMDAFATIVSNNLNVVMKFLTSIAVILIIPTIVGTFFGMNVPLPIRESKFAFTVVVGLSILVSAIVAVIFRKKHWM
jgi:magnesium transporter